MISADQVVSWFEENGDKNDLPEEVTALRKVGEEDNPVVIIMELNVNVPPQHEIPKRNEYERFMTYCLEPVSL